jgi:hypothetical protein
MPAAPDVALVYQVHSETMDLNSFHCILQFIKPTVQVAAFGSNLHCSKTDKPVGEDSVAHGVL